MGTRRTPPPPEKEKALLQHLFEGFQEAVVLLNSNGTILKVNGAFSKLFGYAPGEVAGKNIDDLLAPGEYNEEAKGLTSSVISGERLSMETRRRRKNGTYVDVSIFAAPVMASGSLVGYYGIYLDITDRVRTMEKLARSRRRIQQLHVTARKLDNCQTEGRAYRITVDAAASILDFPYSIVAAMKKDVLTPVTFSKREMRNALKKQRFIPGKDIVGKAFMEKKTTRVDDVPGGEIFHFETGESSFELLLVSPIGEYGAFLVFTGDTFSIDDEQVSLLELLLSYSADAVKRIRLLDELREQAIHDPLTGLYNRNYFNYFMQKETERFKRYHHSVSIIMLDVNNFKTVNDRFGHQVGDAVLKKVAEALRSTLRKSDTIIRYGGDEFLVLLPETRGNIDRLIERMRRNVEKIEPGNGYDTLKLSISIGSAVWKPWDGTTIDSVLSEADNRMYMEKHGDDGDLET